MDIVVMIMLGLIYALVRWAVSVYRSIHAPRQSTERSSFSIFRRRTVTVDWGWKEPVEVGSTMSFKIKFYGIARSPRSISDVRNLKIEITRNHLAIAHVEEPSDRLVLDEDQSFSNEITVFFTVRASGVYKISVYEDGRAVAESPYEKTFIPGLPVASRTSMIRTLNMSSVLPIVQNKSNILSIEPRDEFGNVCGSRLHSSLLRDRFELMVTEINSDCCPIPISTDLRMTKDNVIIDLFVPVAGCFHAVATYEKQEIGNGEFDLIVLAEKDSVEVEENVNRRNLNVWYEAHAISRTAENWFDNSDKRPGFTRALSMGEMPTTSRPSEFRSRRLSTMSGSDSKPKKVFIYLTPKQLIIKEFYFLIIPKRLQSFRLCQATKISILSAECSGRHAVILISDGCQPSITLSCARAPVMIATFIEMINKHIGGSDSFDEKVKHFREELLAYHNLSRFTRGKSTLTIGRQSILQDSYKQTKNFSAKDWCKQFDISFKDEYGVDWGGLSREWVSMLCKELFIPPVNETSELQGAQGDFAKLSSNSYFRRLKDDNQALVLPACCSSSGAKLKMFEFAGKLVGKCLVDGTCGQDQVRYIDARFARSFLAQLIGLAVTYKHFESDDPELYKSKIRYIIENDVTDFDLCFAEEVYLPNGKLHQVVPLKHGGAKIRVTNENKLEYLNCLARYRLSTSIKQETETFLKGLNSLVPDHLLSVFDENELELVICGSSKISVSDMRQHSIITDNSFLFAKMLDWFWVAVSSLTQDELAMLLQFTTGCSQLPPGGFSDLSPRFKISFAFYHRNNLPTAHTCFNELCLPSYDSYENLHKFLKLAITEGATGFGMI